MVTDGMAQRDSDPGRRNEASIRFWVAQDYKENRRKCTVEPLRGHADIEFCRLGKPRPGERCVSAPGGLILEVGAPVLRPSDRELLSGDQRVVVLDASWARLEPLRRRIAFPDESRLARRSLPSEIVTAYPRHSKLFEDPDTGLATVEALFAVTAILGEPRPEFLETYHWAEAFLAANAPRLATQASGAI